MFLAGMGSIITLKMKREKMKPTINKDYTMIINQDELDKAYKEFCKGLKTKINNRIISVSVRRSINNETIVEPDIFIKAKDITFFENK